MIAIAGPYNHIYERVQALAVELKRLVDDGDVQSYWRMLSAKFYHLHCKKPFLIIMKNESVKLIYLCIRSPDVIN